MDDNELAKLVEKTFPKGSTVTFVAMPDEAWNRLNICSEKGHDLNDEGHCKRCDF